MSFVAAMAFLAMITYGIVHLRLGKKAEREATTSAILIDKQSGASPCLLDKR